MVLIIKMVFSYSQNTTGKSLIDNPPGFTMASAGKSFTTPTPVQTNGATKANLQ